MTNPRRNSSSAGGVSVLEPTVNGAPVLGISVARLDTVAATAAGPSTTSPERSQDRVARLRLLAGSALGVGCLLLAQRLGAGHGSQVAGPPGLVAWTAAICGIAGIWLVPGLWLSAVMMRTGPGPVAWLATRVGTTIAWYALVGPVIHVSAQGAWVTIGGIIGATLVATSAVCLGVTLALLVRPAGTSLRILIGAVAGGVCAQTVIWVLMRVWTYGVNYQHIRRLDWLIVLGCALLTTIGAHGRPDLPSVRTAGQIRIILIFLAVVAITAVALVTTGSRWSTEQRMPSAFGAEQIPAPPGADVAFALTAIGPQGRRLIEGAFFSASDESGSPVPIHTSVVGERDTDHVTLLVAVDPASRLMLCGRDASALEQGWPVKLTIRDHASGLLAQAVIPPRWCGT
jgi:hypothetical protein